MSKQITEAIKTAKKIAVFELEKIMYNNRGKQFINQRRSRANAGTRKKSSYYFRKTKIRYLMTQDTVKIVIGGAGVAASTAVEHIPIDQLEGGMGIITQIVILVATLIGLFKKKKEPQIEEKSKYLENE